MANSSDQLKQDIKLLFEIGTLKKISLGWSSLVRTDLQNVSEHSFRTIWISYILSQYYKEASVETILKYALAKNLWRTRVSDPHYIALPNVVLNRDKAIRDILKGSSIEEEFSSLINNYYKLDSLESEIVFVSNTIENILELNELMVEGLEVAKTWLELNYKTFYPKIKLKPALKLLDQIKIIKPYNWHLIIKDAFELNEVIVSGSRQEKEINFLYEVGTMRYLPRNWLQFTSTNFSNVSEHTYRVLWIALVLSKKEKNIDVEKLLLMLLLHDLDEVRGLDLNYIHKQYVQDNKEQSIKGTLKGLKQEVFLNNLYSEYRLNESPEAKLAKDADSLEAIFELKEKSAEGISVANNWIESNKKRLMGKLSYDYSNNMLDELFKADPNAWHLEGKNRFSTKW